MRIAMLATVAMLSAGVAAHADVIQNFTIDSILQGGYSASGTVSIDVTTGKFTRSDFYLLLGGTQRAEFITPSFTEAYAGGSVGEFQGSVSGYTFDLKLPDATLTGYTGGPICTTASPCGGGSQTVAYLPVGSAPATDGSLTLNAITPIATTPEPSSFALLGTSILGAVSVIRRRL